MEKEHPRRQYLLTVGNIDKSNATLVDLDYNMLQLPRYLLPSSTKPGSVVRLTLTHETAEQQRRNAQKNKLQSELKGGNTARVLEE